MASSSPQLTSAVVAEKPSVARDIARVLGAVKRGEGYLHGNGWVVTWAIGHLAALPEPHEINPAWRKWRRADLPILPDQWPLKVYPNTADQFAVVRRILSSEKVGRVVCATDAGREGELIFRYIYEAAGCRKPVERLWISSLTPEAIEKGFAKLEPGARYDALADAARARSRADWLVGMNLSRAYSIDHDDNLSVGRVQTPTLAILVRRELEIRGFKPEDYFEVVAEFTTSPGDYKGTYFRAVKGKRVTKLAGDGEEAARIAARAEAGEPRVESVDREKKSYPAPLLYDLTELQRRANRTFGFSAGHTLEVAQQLYERHKLITYPRTDSRHLSKDVAAGLPKVVDAVAGPYRDDLAPGTGEKPLGKRFVDDTKVTDHHAIIPTGKPAGDLDPASDEGRLFDLICRRLLAAWHKPLIKATTTVITRIDTKPANDDGAIEEVRDLYLTRGTSIEQAGWLTLDRESERGRGSADDEQVPGGLEKGQTAAVLKAEAIKKQTRPPKRFTEATLLTAMESAGKTLDDKELSEAMKERGLGTPATRASTIETLLKRDYIVRNKRALEATDKGVRLIEIAHEKVSSPEMTGEWEAKLKAIERGEGRFEAFMQEIEAYIREVVGETHVAQKPPESEWPDPPADPPKQMRLAAPALAESAKRARVGSTLAAARRAETRFGRTTDVAAAAAVQAVREKGPVAASDLGELLRSAFGFEQFRPHQEDVCRTAVEGRDILLVMPTGAGKSLCYQLPGMARGGTTLVISPLIALMEDQVAKLLERGFRAERIHSGRDRGESRQVCRDYLDGNLDFLFIAPERLGVPGFIEMLAKRTPSLIAVDEAHCISQWGHDFRPDYRMLGGRLPQLRPAPILAATATATPVVQDDICEQLGLTKPLRSIHGFRRDNIAVEVVELTPKQRTVALMAILRDPDRRPAIVYAPTRKAAEQQADDLKAEIPASAYHAGLTASSRDQVQARFLGGDCDVIVATIAFGMGIDKANVRTVIHTGLPGSVEGYYQEIGRAGRDGLPSRAVLMHSWNDRRTHEFFVDRDYPPVDDVTRIFNALGEQPIGREELEARLDLDPQVFEKALEKLWIHHGALVEPDESVTRGEPGWRGPYLRQREHKLEQLAAISRYTESYNCRMLDLVDHFGDQEDSHKPCGHCDVCAPEGCVAQRRRAPTASEADALDAVIAALRQRDGQATGRLFRELFESSDIDRKRYNKLLSALARAGFVGVSEDSFETEGRVIEFRRVSLTHEGRTQEGSVSPYIQVEAEAPKAPSKARKRTKKAKAGGAARRKGARAANTDAPNADASVAEALKEWRLSEARRRSVPAFTIFPNRTLDALASLLPTSEGELLETPGIGPKVAKRYGQKLLELIAEAGGVKSG